MLDDILKEQMFEVNSFTYQAKCKLLAKKISTNQRLLQIFIKNNPDYRVIGDFRCPLHYVYAYYIDGAKALYIASSDKNGRKITSALDEDSNVLETWLPNVISVEIAEESFTRNDDKYIDELLLEKGLPPIKRAPEDVERKKNQESWTIEYLKKQMLIQRSR